MVLKKKDFVEIEFTGRIKGGEVFDSNVKEEVEKLHQGHDHPINVKPFVFCLGEGMFLKAVDEFLIGKDVGKTYELSLTPDEAFGKRNQEMVYTMPLKVFTEKNINPVPGAAFNFDGRIGRVLTVSGGRVRIDFNHFLAGKDVEYKITILKKIEDIKDKIKALNEFFFGKDLPFEVKGDKIIIKADASMAKFVELFKEQFKNILGMDLEVSEIENKAKDEDKVKKSQ